MVKAHPKKGPCSIVRVFLYALRYATRYAMRSACLPRAPVRGCVCLGRSAPLDAAAGTPHRSPTHPCGRLGDHRGAREGIAGGGGGGARLRHYLT